MEQGLASGASVPVTPVPAHFHLSPVIELIVPWSVPLMCSEEFVLFGSSLRLICEFFEWSCVRTQNEFQ